jgi:hypothetical protein
MESVDYCIVILTVLIITLGIMICYSRQPEKYEVENQIKQISERQRLTPVGYLASHGDDMVTIAYPTVSGLVLNGPNRFQLNDTYRLAKGSHGAWQPLAVANAAYIDYRDADKNFLTTQGYQGGGNIFADGGHKYIPVGMTDLSAWHSNNQL